MLKVPRFQRPTACCDVILGLLAAPTWDGARFLRPILASFGPAWILDVQGGTQVQSFGVRIARCCDSINRYFVYRFWNASSLTRLIPKDTALAVSPAVPIDLDVPGLAVAPACPGPSTGGLAEATPDSST